MAFSLLLAAPTHTSAGKAGKNLYKPSQGLPLTRGVESVKVRVSQKNSATLLFEYAVPQVKTKPVAEEHRVLNGSFCTCSG